MKHFLPRIERIAFDSTISHFLLMFGYKLFSSFFPLYLVSIGLSITKVGYTYLLIYLPIVIFAPVVGGLLYRVNPVYLSSLGILGYGVYSLGLLTAPSLFNPIQVLLGVSAALFFVSSRTMLIRSKLHNYDAAYGWFYSVPTYADLLAPAAGALIIKFFGFPGVFAVSFGVHLLNMIFSSHRLLEDEKREVAVKNKIVSVPSIVHDYGVIFKGIRDKGMAGPVLTALVMLIVDGFFSAFFILFLKNYVGFTSNQILLYVAIISLLFVPLSILTIRFLNKERTVQNIFKGSIVFSIASILFGTVAAGFNVAGIVAINLLRGFGWLNVSSGRSGIISRSFPEESEEAGVIDTILSPLGTAIGALAGGLLVTSFGYPAVFVGGGMLILLTTLLFLRKARSG